MIPYLNYSSRRTRRCRRPGAARRRSNWTPRRIRLRPRRRWRRIQRRRSGHFERRLRTGRIERRRERHCIFDERSHELELQRCAFGLHRSGVHHQPVGGNTGPTGTRARHATPVRRAPPVRRALPVRRAIQVRPATPAPTGPTGTSGPTGTTAHRPTGITGPTASPVRRATPPRGWSSDERASRSGRRVAARQHRNHERPRDAAGLVVQHRGRRVLRW